MTKQISVYPNAELYFFGKADDANAKMKELGIKQKRLMRFNEAVGALSNGRFIGLVCAENAPEAVKDAAPKLSIIYHEKVGLKRTPASCERVTAMFAVELMGLIGVRSQ